MFRVIKAELKKMVSKPGIFILAVFLAVILVLGVFLYHPQKRVYDVETITLEVKNFDTPGGQRENAISKKDKTISAVNAYFVEDEEGNLITHYEKMYGEDGKSGLWSHYDVDSWNMRYYATDADVEKFRGTIKEINDLITNAVNKSGELAYIVLISNDDYNSYANVYKNINTEFDKENLTTKNKIDNFKSHYQTEYESLVKKFKFPTISTSLVKTYTDAETKGTNLNTINTRLAELDVKISEVEDKYESLPSTSDSKKDKDELVKEYNRLVNIYVGQVDVYYKLVKYELMSNAFKFVNTNESLNLKYLTEHSEYNSNTQLIKYSYIFNNNKVERDYSNPLAVGSTIIDKITAYDYAYFILKLFSFIIIAYAIMSCCGAIAGEIKEGSMRYYAIRPINRNNILFGKLISIIVMSTIILIFSTIVATCVGIGVYGWTNINILTIFNGKTAIVMHPLGMIALFMLGFILELIVYSSIAILLSCLLKSDLLASTLMLLLYLLNIILPVFAGGMNSWLAFYPFSHISLFALFGSSIVPTGNDMLSSLLKVNVYASTSLAPTIILTVLLVILPLVGASRIFKRKEL